MPQFHRSTVTGSIRWRARHLPAAFALASCVAAAACTHRESQLTPRDLTRDEVLYVTRVLVLERARAAVLTDPGRGAALADSLRTAWGDSALPRTVELAPADPERAAGVHQLLLRLLAAEQDSLLRLGGRRPLDAPWPAPADSVTSSRFPAAVRGDRDD